MTCVSMGKLTLSDMQDIRRSLEVLVRMLRAVTIGWLTSGLPGLTRKTSWLYFACKFTERISDSDTVNEVLELDRH